MERPTPDILYRYRHLVGPHREWTARTLRDSILYFASPASFNDPLDCRVHFTLTSSDAELRRNHQRLIKKFVPHLNRAQRRAKAAEDLRNLDRTTFLEAITQGLQIEVDKAGVLCLSEAADDIVLWSHYADGHKGLCLAFSVASDAAFFAPAQAVTYSQDCPKIDLLRDSRMKHVDVILLTKAAGWAYEAEWRIVDHVTGWGEKAFSPQALVAVILGARMPAEDRSFVVECLRTRAQPVQLFEARIKACHYELDIPHIEP